MSKFYKSSDKSILPKTPSQSATKPTPINPVQRGGSPITYGGGKQPIKSKSNGNVTNPVSQSYIQKTVKYPPKHLEVTEDIVNENHSFDKHLLSHNSVKPESTFDGKDKFNYSSSHTHASSHIGNTPKDTDRSKEIRGANSCKNTSASSSQTNTQSVPQETNNRYKQISATQTNSSEIQTNINRSVPPTTSQPYTDASNKHQSIGNKQTPIFPNWDTDTSPGITTSISQYTPHNIPRPVAKQPTECKPTRGLKNLGNTCFMNCILQCLSHTIPLRQLYVSGDYKRYLGNRRGDLSFMFRKVMEDLWDTSSDSLAPHELKRQVGIVAPRFSGYNQHDAQEFMRFLLNELHDEINGANVKGRKSPADNETLGSALERYLTWEDSKISDLFGGMLRSTVCCLVCRHPSTVYDPFMDLALPIPKKKPTFPRSIYQYSPSYDTTLLPAVQLSECLQIFTTEETLDEEERPYCARCKKLTKSTKQLEIAKLPSYLVIQLKRFSGYHVRTKLSTPVSFEDIWKLKDSDNNTHTYSLYGIVSHSGGIYGGHYVAYCRYKDVWRSFNDNMCRALSWEHVKQQEAYILFYEKED